MSMIVNGVEYAQTPVPSDLWRATKYAYAVDMMKDGLVYMSNAQKYRNDPDPERGDPTETDGRFIRQGVTCKTGHTNPIFLWCATLDSNPESVLAVWKDCDTVIMMPFCIFAGSATRNLFPSSFRRSSGRTRLRANSTFAPLRIVLMPFGA